MAIIRCPQCRLPLIEEEASNGACPVCAAPLRATAPPPALVPAASPPPPRAVRPRPWSLYGNLVLLVLLAGSEVCLLWPPRQAGPPPEKVAVKQTSTPTQQPAGPKEPGATEGPVPPAADPDRLPPPPAAHPKPPARRRAFASLPLLPTSAITIDGDLSDWKDIPPVALKVVQKNESGKQPVLVPKTQLAYLAYCPEGLLLAVDVEDTSGELENVGRPPPPARPGVASSSRSEDAWAFWTNDAVEVYLDTRNSHARERGAASLHQFFAFPFGTPTDAGTGGYESRILKDGAGHEDWSIVPLPATGAQAMPRAGRKTPGGWTLETLIPKSALRQAEIKPGNLLGFELQIDTGTNLYYYWASDDPFVQASMHPDVWGEVLLAGADATVAVLDAAGKPSPVFVPGRPLTVRVTDADVDLDPAARDALVVTLRSRSGDLKKVALQETAPGAGVFAGTIATRLSDGRRQEDVFDVLDDDEISVEYVDRWRSNGDQNVTVRTTVTASGPAVAPRTPGG